MILEAFNGSYKKVPDTAKITYFNNSSCDPLHSLSTLRIWRNIINLPRMSEYDNVVAGKLRLKGVSALDVKSGVTKKKKHHQIFFPGKNLSTDPDLAVKEERLTAAERRYLERWQQLERQRMAKSAAKSHRDRVQEFNQYLANLSEHYDIPKVGPG